METYINFTVKHVFSIEKADEPDTDAPLEEREVGGLGIFLVKKAMDQVRYAHRNGNNILRIEKYF